MTTEIESVFLISKSNCAFANYDSPAACETAIAWIRCSHFYGRQLVCRRRAKLPSAPSTPSLAASDDLTVAPRVDSIVGIPSSPERKANDYPVIVGGDQQRSAFHAAKTTTVVSQSLDRTESKLYERFFIIKSLTAQDLIASVNNGIWEAQSHNEDLLQHAFATAENVYLIFSVNKSGQYFGLARMTSEIHDSESRGNAITTSSAVDPYEPQVIPTAATTTAPSGKVHYDGARGTIFWEVDRGEDEAEAMTSHQRRQFRVQWLSTACVPFYKTRGLKNPWNNMKEVKIARDGTELEPNIGRHLVGMFGRIC